VTKTKISVSFTDKMLTYVYHLKFQSRLGDAKKGKYSGDIKKSLEFYKIHEKEKQGGPLSKERIKELTDFQIQQTIDAKQRAQSAIKEEDKKKSLKKQHMQHKGAFFLELVLNKFGSEINSVVNIGSRVDIVSAYLASKFPKIIFTSVDFQPNLEENNKYFSNSGNWKFMSGYALDLLKQGKLTGDLFFTTSTSVRFNNKELDEYLDEFAKKSKFVVLNEGWWFSNDTKNPFNITRPEEIPIDDPFCAGKYGDYHHNYIKKLVDRSFEILSSEILPGYSFFTLQIVAKNKKK